MSVKNAYKKGFLDGMEAFAYMKDGVSYVGTTGTTLKQAKEGLVGLWNYNPPKETTVTFEVIKTENNLKNVGKSTALCLKEALDYYALEVYLIDERQGKILNLNAANLASLKTKTSATKEK